MPQSPPLRPASPCGARIIGLPTSPRLRPPATLSPRAATPEVVVTLPSPTVSQQLRSELPYDDDEPASPVDVKDGGSYRDDRSCQSSEELESPDGYEMLALPGSLPMPPSRSTTPMSYGQPLAEKKREPSPSSEPDEPVPSSTAIKPTLRLLFSISPRRELLLFPLPALGLSLCAGVLPFFVSILLGRAFDNFSTYQTTVQQIYSQTTSPTALAVPAEKLRHDQLAVTISLFVLGVLQLVFTTGALTMWAAYGERVALRLRQMVYDSISSKSLAWFDTGMGGDKEGDESSDGLGGLTSRFSREIDDVRIAIGQNVGTSLQYAVTFLACAIEAFYFSYQLTFVILAGFPVVIILTAVSERFVTPLLTSERDITASIAGRTERVFGAIATVKAFNAQDTERGRLLPLLRAVDRVYTRLCFVWGLRLGFTSFILLSMFVQGFWFGSYLVNKGDITGGTVSLVFWACLLSASHLQLIVPLLTFVDKGKIGMAGLLELIRSEAPVAAAPPVALDVKKTAGGANRPLQRLRPTHFSGELALRNVSFWYPARPRPAPAALRNASIYVPPRETTYIVGQSGSGKSTVGALLMGMYTAEAGRCEADEQEIDYLDPQWLRAHIAMVSQGQTVLLDASIHDNVAMGAIGAGRHPGTVSREEVVAACRGALIHDFVRDLPDGYDTIVSGEKGASLSGGQRQRLALARAWIRDPTVLILDEATSALDVTSRLLVHEAVKQWRQNRTTIVITHDLSPISATDFVYVMRDGTVVEEGYRSDLEAREGGYFRQMAEIQAARSDEPEDLDPAPAYTADRSDDSVLNALVDGVRADRPNLHAPSLLGPWLDGSRQSLALSRVSTIGRRSSFNRSRSYVDTSDDTPPLPSDTAPLARQSSGIFLTVPGLDGSIPFRRERPANSRQSSMTVMDTRTADVSRTSSDISLQAMEQLAKATIERRPRDGRRLLPAAAADHDAKAEFGEVGIQVDSDQPVALPSMGFWRFVRTFYPLVPSKWVLVLGLFFCVVTGVATPVFSLLVAQLLAALVPGSGVDTTLISLLVILVAAIDGISQCARYTLMQAAGMRWVTSMREKAFSRTLAQDKTFFDRPANTPIALSNVLTKDGEDARNLIGVVLGQFLVVIVMLGLGLIWALAIGWQLTLAGFAVAPLFVVSLAWQARVVDRYERINKTLREDTAKHFHAAVANVRAIRSMALETVFAGRFAESSQATFKSQLRAAPYVGICYAVSSAVPRITEGVMFYVGAVLMANGTYTLQQTLQAFSLMSFSVAFSGAMLGYIPAISKSARAALDMLRLLQLETDTAESRGKDQYAIAKAPTLSFSHVDFAYPTRPDVPVLHDLSFDVRAGESVALVGASGAGKSSVAALLQRLYEPGSGQVLLDGHPLSSTDVRFLRDHVAVVAQNPALFDDTVEANVLYGVPYRDMDAVVRAARMADVHDFVSTKLPAGYRTNLGDNASLLSGGQAQRIAIARALVRPRQVLLFDEATSALDPESQRAVMRTIESVKAGRTTVVITHKVDVMRLVDRIIVLDDGRLAEQGTFDELMAKRGAFASLASAGEWQ